MAAIVTDDGRCDLFGRNLATHRRGGTDRVAGTENAEKVVRDDATAVLDTVRDRFGIHIENIPDH